MCWVMSSLGRYRGRCVPLRRREHADENGLGQLGCLRGCRAEGPWIGGVDLGEVDGLGDRHADKDDQIRSRIEINADEIAPSLRRVTATITKTTPTNSTKPAAPGGGSDEHFPL
jgi:hypothetical protein